VIQRFFAPTRCTDEEVHLLAYYRLTDVFGQAQRPDRTIELFFAFPASGRDEPISFDHERPPSADSASGRSVTSSNAWRNAGAPAEQNKGTQIRLVTNAVVNI
jgi:hypothetical protein